MLEDLRKDKDGLIYFKHYRDAYEFSPINQAALREGRYYPLKNSDIDGMTSTIKYDEQKILMK